MASVLTPIIVEMAHDAKWRVRLSVVEKLSMLASQLVYNNYSFCRMIIVALLSRVSFINISVI